MPATQERTNRRTRRRLVRVTGRKLAAVASPSVHAAFGLDPREGVRPHVAMMASETNTCILLDTASFFVDSLESLEGLAVPSDQLSVLRERLRKRLGSRGVSHSVRPLRVQRLRCEEYNGYPLRRTQLVVFNREGGQVTASLSEVADILGIKGIGIDKAAALRDLERQFDQVVRTKVRIPPHVREERDEAVRRVVNHLVDWQQFARENPHPTPLWGQVVSHRLFGLPRVYWLLGPGGIRKARARLPVRYANVYFNDIPEGGWFYAVIRDFPDRVEWIEPPHSVPDPNDPAARKAAWDAIPVIVADDPDAWPLKPK